VPVCFGDGFECYAAPADAIAGYWDSGTVGFTLVTGRFSGSQAIQNAVNNAWLVKTGTGTTDAVHHISCGFQQTAAISGTTLGLYFKLSDGATDQCSVVFRSDGAILLASGLPNGTVLATYTGAVTAASTWYQFEIEVVISNTVGRFRVRKLGNPSDDFDSGATLNTRPGTNAQANKLTVGAQASVSNHLLDDLLWRSDASSVPWVGDIRCFTRRPTSDAAVQWTPSGATVPVTPFAQTTTAATGGNGVTKYVPFIAPCTGTIGTVTAPITTAGTVNIKCAIYASSGTAPTTSLGSATAPVTNPGVGTATWTFGTPVAVTQGTQYWVGTCCDASSGVFGAFALGLGGLNGSTTYASFPAANPSSLTASAAPAHAITITPTAAINAPMVADNAQDGATTYNYSSTVGQSDLYGISAISSTPASVVAVTTRAYLQKSDAGTRNVAVQLKSGSTTVSSTSAALNTTWGWQSRTDTTDPATGAAWTAVGVNNAQVGVVVVA
jgi:hypothetical protein